MNQYLRLLDRTLTQGLVRTDRTGVGTISTFGHVIRFDMKDGFPAVTTKKLYFSSVAAELAGFLSGVQYSSTMKALGTNIWDANANDPTWQASKLCEGQNHMGRVYGVQWRSWRKTNYLVNKRAQVVTYVDQLRNVLDRIKVNPTDRRLLVTAWNPGELDEMCLPPCHYAFQYYVRGGGTLDIMMHMRSVDMFLGMPFDIASYALLLHISARDVGLMPGELIITTGDTHIYLSHLDQVHQQLGRTPHKLPALNLSTECHGIDSFKPHHAELVNYVHHPSIKAPMAL